MKNSNIVRIALAMMAISGVVFVSSDSLTASALFEQSEVSVSERGRILLERRQADDSIARLDRIILENGSDTVELFASEGRAIEQVLEEDLDLDGEKELLIQMDLGGSGGFKEFSLLHNKDGKYTQIWEETGFCAGNAMIADRDGDGRPNIYIEYADTEVKPTREETAIFTLENGEVKKAE